MRISRQESLTTNRSAQECLAAARETMEALRMNPRPLNGNGVQGRRGSRLAMAFLGVLAGSNLMPVKIEAKVVDAGAERTLSLNAVENYLFPAYLYFKPRMRKAVDLAVTQVRDALQQRLGES